MIKKCIVRSSSSVHAKIVHLPSLYFPHVFYCLYQLFNIYFHRFLVYQLQVTLICAGHDTTAYFSAYLILCLAQNPDCQELLRTEILRVVAGSSEITAEHVSEMKYLQKVHAKSNQSLHLNLYTDFSFFTQF